MWEHCARKSSLARPRMWCPTSNGEMLTAYKDLSLRDVGFCFSCNILFPVPEDKGASMLGWPQ